MRASLAARASLRPQHRRQRSMPIPPLVQLLDVCLYWLVYVLVLFIRLVPLPA